MAGTSTSGAVAPDRAAARLVWLAEKDAVAKRYRAYAHAWVQRRICSMEQRGEITVGMSLDRFIDLRRSLFSKVPEYDDATGKARKPPKGPRP
jgi:hypothetical protein